MGNYMGGSAWAMSQQISQGFILVNERTFSRLQAGEMDKLAFEMEKLLREVRSEQPPLEDIPALQNKNRRLSRLTGAISQLRHYRMRHRR
ncbi:MAG TPA: hypothetical protein VMT16_03730 [Thermoanaerobaculia bacterium]|nr:hypothetical protein [Thermoanaerobaculia bacterium]